MQTIHRVTRDACVYGLTAGTCVHPPETYVPAAGRHVLTGRQLLYAKTCHLRRAPLILHTLSASTCEVCSKQVAVMLPLAVHVVRQQSQVREVCCIPAAEPASVCCGSQTVQILLCWKRTISSRMQRRWLLVTHQWPCAVSCHLHPLGATCVYIWSCCKTVSLHLYRRTLSNSSQLNRPPSGKRTPPRPTLDNAPVAAAPQYPAASQLQAAAPAGTSTSPGGVVPRRRPPPAPPGGQ